eukprot:515209-Prymnesium_polylepis.1
MGSSMQLEGGSRAGNSGARKICRSCREMPKHAKKAPRSREQSSEGYREGAESSQPKHTSLAHVPLYP